MTLFISVVLPAPLRPMRPATMPAGSSSETSRRIWTAWIDTLRFSSLSTRHPAHHVALHLCIRERDLRRRVGDNATAAERQHPLRKAAHDFHVVLDEKDRGALGTHCLEHHFHDAELLLRRDAARRLIEQQDARLGDHRQCNVEELAHAAGKDLRILVAVIGEAESVENSIGHLFGRRVVARHLRPAARKIPAAPGVAQHDAQSDHHVLVYAERAVELRHLERAADAQARDLARRQARDIALSVENRPRIGLEIARDHIDESRLAGAIGADEPDDRVPLEQRVHVACRRDSPETLVKTPGVEDGCHLTRPCAGRRATIARWAGTRSARAAPYRGSSARCWATNRRPWCG